MEDLVIFTSMPMCIAMGGIVLLHLLGTLIPEFMGGEGAVKGIVAWVVSILNAVLHFLVIGYAFIKGAKPEEMLLFVMISAAVAMTSIGIREKISKGKKK